MNFKKRKIRNNLSRIRKALEKSAPVNEASSIEKTPIHHSANSENITPEITSIHSAPSTRQPSKNHQTIKYLTIIAGIALIVGLIWITIGLVKSLDFGSLIFSFGKDLKKDDAKMTNFLMVGVGGYGHDGSNLTDTIIIASLNPKTKSVKMLSIPRDLYVDDTLTGGQKINSVYDGYLNKYGKQKGMEKFSDMITSITDIPIQYTIKIDFDGFTKIVDALDGITVDVEKPIHDTTYPKGETIYFETFDISAGIHELDGETALKYARSRHTTSDFDRARRQQQILSAIKEKALSTSLLTDPARIQALYNSVADSIETNLSIAEIIELAKLSKDINKDDIQSRVINDNWSSCGGILYTPNRDYFRGAAVLLPAGNSYDELKAFAKNYFYSDIQADAPIQVLNATKTSGLALNYLNRFSQNCLNVIYYGNATNREQATSIIYYNPIQTQPTDGTTATPTTNTTSSPDQIPPAVEVIKKILNATVVKGIPPEYLSTEKRSPAQVVVEIGADYKAITTPDPFNNLMYTAPTKTETTDTEKPIEPEKPLNSASNKTTDKTNESGKSTASSNTSDKSATTTSTKTSTTTGKTTTITATSAATTNSTN